MEPNKVSSMSELDPMFSGVSLQSLLSLISNTPTPAEPLGLIPKRPCLVLHPTDAPAQMSSRLARQRRQKLSEKTRCLQKLMPWDKKMDQATLLEEAYKYVRFLQSQLSTLLSMPSSSSSTFITNIGGPDRFGELEMLSRNQVLQVLVNSPVAQTVMASHGLCVFSAEQLALLLKLSTDTRLLLHHFNFHHLPPPPPPPPPPAHDAYIPFFN